MSREARSLALPLSAALLLAAAGAAAAAPCPPEAQAFWGRFREAALRADAEALARLTRFPLRVAGTLDGSRTEAVTPARFRAVLPRLLAADAGMAVEPVAMREFARRTPTLPSQRCAPGGRWLRLGSWVFAEGTDGWRLVEAFTDD